MEIYLNTGIYICSIHAIYSEYIVDILRLTPYTIPVYIHKLLYTGIHIYSNSNSNCNSDEFLVSVPYIPFPSPLPNEGFSLSFLQ